MTASLPLDRPNVSPSFFDRDPSIVAQELLGCAFARFDGLAWVGGFIVETEAYLHRDDLASHSAKGETRRCASMFGPPGTAYVYSIHNRFCMNFVTQSFGIGSAVLIRALQPVWGIDSIKQRRSNDDSRKWTSGPGMICQAMGIDRRVDGVTLDRSNGWLLTGGHQVDPERIARTPRIGITHSEGLLLRFFVAGNRFVSGRAMDHGRPRIDSFA